MIDYMLMEAVAIKYTQEERKAQEDAERKRQVEEARQTLKKEFGG